MNSSSLQQYWSRPETYDARAFDETRYTEDNLLHWVPHLVRLGSIHARQRVLDIGCGTGGFPISIAKQTGAHLVGLDVSASLIEYAKAKPDANAVEWVVGDAEHLTFGDCCFDCIIMSLVLHQVRDRERALREAFRVLKSRGTLVVRTLSPDEVAKRIPFCFFPRVAEIESARMPRIEHLLDWLSAARFQGVRTEVIRRNRELCFDRIAREIRARSRPSYRCLSSEDMEDGIERMRHESDQCGPNWVDPRPTTFIVGRKI